MATFTVFTPIPGNKKPVIGNYSLVLGNREDKVLSSNMFTTSTNPAYYDPNGQTPTTVKITSLPTIGTLQYNGIPVTIRQEIPLSHINNGQLIWVAPLQDDFSSVSFGFNVSDGIDYAESEGLFTVINSNLEIVINLRPVVGDKEIDILYSQTYNFSQADFITETTPVFYDPEGDAASIIRIVSLPSKGVLKLSGVNMTVGQEITIAEASSITYAPENTSYTAHQIKFKFKASDVGSGEFSRNDGVITINVEAMVSNPPVVDDNSALLVSTTYQSKYDDFTKNFTDPELDSPLDVKILTLPQIGTLHNLGNILVVNTEIAISNINGLVYTLPVTYTVENGILFKYPKAPSLIVLEYETLGYKLSLHQDGMMIFENSEEQSITIDGEEVGPIFYKFKTSDDSPFKLYSNIATFTLVPDGDINTEEPYINLPPTVGNNTIDL